MFLSIRYLEVLTAHTTGALAGKWENYHLFHLLFQLEWCNHIGIG